ncbi:hypothetical protein [Flavobacterium chilense]|uniref:Uncharacterized protein n=1 Tax=Flavobacterium chilense TaxID=946677 RepID=A0A1M7ABU9_9FLAO|nr:hypothetical protein [Flavobacterium chilense]SHL40148.1 hypothetical protein SAMN05444484_1011370 [Flavobacterium chilense]
MEQLQVIKAKELALKMGVHLNTAKVYIKDIKQEYDIKVVLKCHVLTYFKVNAKIAQ